MVSCGSMCSSTNGACTFGSINNTTSIINYEATIIENLSLGKSSIVGAGVTLRKDLKDSEKYTG